MHDLPASPPPDSNSSGKSWTSELNRYHWFVLIVAALGWLFDTMDQQLFVLARGDAMKDLLAGVDGADPNKYGGIATSVFLIGWACGGIVFGVLGDRIGRAKTMMLTILIYSVFTGLSAFASNFLQFAVFRFLTGLGVGGEFAVGVSLVAEVMPARARPYALGLLQALSAVGNMTAALMSMGLGHLEREGAFTDLSLGGIQIRAWRLMFMVGVLPALLAIAIRGRLKEPEQWQALRGADGEKKRAGSYAELFGDPRWRKRAIVGLLLSSAGIIGLWGIGFFYPELLDSVLRKHYAGSQMPEAEVQGAITFWKGIGSLMTNLGAFFGIYIFAVITQRIGRRPTFALSLIAAMGATLLVFGFLRNHSQIFWMLPLMGFCQLSLFGGYAIYFPELFPTHLRSTGTSFCYNAARILSATGPLLLGRLGEYFKGAGYAEPIRPAAMVMCSVFLVGLLVLPFAPETKDQPLPE